MLKLRTVTLEPPGQPQNPTPPNPPFVWRCQPWRGLLLPLHVACGAAQLEQGSHGWHQLFFLAGGGGGGAGVGAGVADWRKGREMLEVGLKLQRADLESGVQKPSLNPCSLLCYQPARACKALSRGSRCMCCSASPYKQLLANPCKGHAKRLAYVDVDAHMPDGAPRLEVSEFT